MKEIFTVWKKELIDNFRDRRTLITAIMMPIILMPLMLIGTFKLQEYQVNQAEEKTTIIGINKQESAPSLISYLEEQDKVELVYGIGNYKNDIDDGTINVYIEVEEDFETVLSSQGIADVSLYLKSSNIDSSTAVSKVNLFLNTFNQIIGVSRLSEQGIDPNIIQGLAINIEDISTAEERGGFIVGLLLPMFIVIFAIVGGMYIAIDVSAGEKERKTLEALLLAPISRFKLVMGKYLAVTTMASITIILSLISMSVAFSVYPPDLAGLGEVVINLNITSVSIMLIIGIIMAFMFSGFLLSVAIFAKSYKEAQNYISPFYLLAVLPVAIANSLPGFKPTIYFFAIPGVNAVFVIKESLLGVYDFTHIMITIISLLIFAAISIVVASKIYSKEGILFRD
ncbi:MAG: ABC transporter permease [Candidatus Kerfeldbacteria bacterium]